MCIPCKPHPTELQTLNHTEQYLSAVRVFEMPNACGFQRGNHSPDGVASLPPQLPMETCELREDLQVQAATVQVRNLKDGKTLNKMGPWGSPTTRAQTGHHSFTGTKTAH